jgi:phosphohistidine phosphatase
MQRRLVIVRHATTGEGSPDIRRQLTERGRRDAATIGRWLVENDVVPDLVVVSPATRAQQTWEIAAGELSVRPEVRIDDRVYDNTVDDVLAVVRDTSDDVMTLGVVGHNPSLGMLAAADSFPTCAIAVFDVSDDWSDFDGTSRPTLRS